MDVGAETEKQHYNADRTSYKKQLDSQLDFYKSDLIKAQQEYNKALGYQKYGLPNYRTEILRRQMGVEEAQQNLRNFKNFIIKEERLGRV